MFFYLLWVLRVGASMNRGFFDNFLTSTANFVSMHYTIFASFLPVAWTLSSLVFCSPMKNSYTLLNGAAGPTLCELVNRKED